MPAATLNAFHTVYLRHSLESANAADTEFSINVNIQPLPRTDDGEVQYVTFTRAVQYCCRKLLFNKS